jgi:hypothetical protein
MAVNETVGINLVADTKSLRSQLREATQELARLQDTAGASAQAIANAARRAAELKDRIGDAKDTIDAFNPDAKFRAFGQSIAGVTGAFAAAQGALALFGVESENVQKQLLKVQGALALSEGLNTILGSIDGFKNLALVIKTQVVEAFATLRGAILASGLGALAVTLAAGYLLWEQYKEGIENVRKKLKQFQEDTARGAKAQKEAELDALERLRKNAINEAKLSGAKEQEISAIEEKFARLKIKTLTRLSEEVRGNVEVQKEYEKELTATKDNLNEIQVNNKLKAQQRELQIAEERAEKEIALEQKRFERLLEIGKKGTPEYEAKLAELNLQYQSDIELFSNNEKTKYFITKKFEEEKFQLFKDNRRKLTEDEEKEIDLKLEKLEIQGAKEIKERNKTASIITSAMDKSLKKSADSEIRTANALKIAKLNIAADTLGILSGFAEQGSGLQKGLALTQIAIDTGVAISGLTASTAAPSPDNLATGGISGFAKYAAGIIKILANIAQAKNIIQSASSGGSSTPNVPVSNTIAPIVPQFQPVAPTALDATSLNTISNVVARAYVVESDITGSQKRIRRIENAARI